MKKSTKILAGLVAVLGIAGLAISQGGAKLQGSFGGAGSWTATVSPSAILSAGEEIVVEMEDMRDDARGFMVAALDANDAGDDTTYDAAVDDLADVKASAEEKHEEIEGLEESMDSVELVRQERYDAALDEYQSKVDTLDNVDGLLAELEPQQEELQEDFDETVEWARTLYQSYLAFKDTYDSAEEAYGACLDEYCPSGDGACLERVREGSCSDEYANYSTSEVVMNTHYDIWVAYLENTQAPIKEDLEEVNAAIEILEENRDEVEAERDAAEERMEAAKASLDEVDEIHRPALEELIAEADVYMDQIENMHVRALEGESSSPGFGSYGVTTGDDDDDDDDSDTGGDDDDDEGTDSGSEDTGSSTGDDDDDDDDSDAVYCRDLDLNQMSDDEFEVEISADSGWTGSLLVYTSDGEDFSYQGGSHRDDITISVDADEDDLEFEFVGNDDDKVVAYIEGEKSRCYDTLTMKVEDDDENDDDDEKGDDDDDDDDDDDGEKKSSSSSQSRHPFSDVDNHWSEDYVSEAYSAGWVKGKSSTRFDPNAHVTVAEFIKMLVNTLGYGPSSGESGFTFVDPNHWAVPYLVTAEELDIVRTRDGLVTNFDSPIDRCSAVMYIARAYDLSYYLQDGEMTFSDVDPDGDHAHCAYAIHVLSITEVDGEPIISGYGNGKFGPFNYLSRSEALKILVLSMELR